jgi:hypothetical protein
MRQPGSQDKGRRREYTPASPCPVCESGTKGCNIGEDGYILCRGASGPRPGFICYGPSKGNPEFTGYRDENHPIAQEKQRRWEADRQQRECNSPPSGKHLGYIDWAKRTADAAANLTPAGRAELADELRVPESVLSALPIGFVPRGPHKKKNFAPAYTFPQVDAEGRIVGIVCRYGDGQKLSWPGGKHGLFVPDGWQNRGGPLYLPEGASDVLALAGLGKVGIGRPSNMAGVDALGKFLKNLPPDQEVIALGERDTKDNGDWPGRDGARWIAQRLTEILGRPVRWAFPPGKAKDVRAWCQEIGLKPDDADAWREKGEEFAVGLKLNDPPKDAQEPEPEPEPPRFQFIDAVDFLSGDYRQEFLIPRILARREPGVIGGPSKALKTSIAIDAAVSMATGTPFLGTFQVPKRCRVAVASGESGRYAICNTVLRILAARGLDRAALERGWLCLEFTLPTFTDAPIMSAFADALAEWRLPGLNEAGTQKDVHVFRSSKTKKLHVTVPFPLGNGRVVRSPPPRRLHPR